MDHNKEVFVPLSDGHRLEDALVSSIPQLLPRVLRRLVDLLPGYESMPTEEIETDVRRLTDRNLRGFAFALANDGAAPDDLLAQAKESAFQRGEEGIGIETIFGAYLLGIEEGFHHMHAELVHLDPEQLVRLAIVTSRYQQQLHRAVAAGYLEQRESVVGETESTRGALLAGLIEGTGFDEIARMGGVSLPPSFLVLGLMIGHHPDEADAHVDPLVAGRRKARRVRIELERRTPDQVLVSLSADGGVALVPADSRHEDPHALQQRLATAAGADVTVAYLLAEPREVSRATRLAHEILDVVRSSGRPPGAYQLGDVLLDYQLSRPTAATEELATKVAPLLDHPVLVEALEAYIAAGRRRQATATALGVHPNTVDNRLERLRRLTSLDPTDVDDLAMLRAALAASHST